MNRVEHVLFGDGTVIEPRTTESRKPAFLVKFDASEIDRLVLVEFLKPSTSSAPGDTPKKGRKKPARARKIVKEPISDKLFVPELDDVPTEESQVEPEETAALN